MGQLGLKSHPHKAAAETALIEKLKGITTQAACETKGQFLKDSFTVVLEAFHQPWCSELGNGKSLTFPRLIIRQQAANLVWGPKLGECSPRSQRNHMYRVYFMKRFSITDPAAAAAHSRLAAHVCWCWKSWNQQQSVLSFPLSSLTSSVMVYLQTKPSAHLESTNSKSNHESGLSKYNSLLHGCMIQLLQGITVCGVWTDRQTHRQTEPLSVFPANLTAGWVMPMLIMSNNWINTK